MDLGLDGLRTEITGVALTLIPDTELTSQSSSGWERADSGNSYKKASLLQAKQRVGFPSSQLLDRAS